MVCAIMREAHAQTVVERSAVGLNDLLCGLVSLPSPSQQNARTNRLRQVYGN